jgi:hypothetical protein
MRYRSVLSAGRQSYIGRSLRQRVNAGAQCLAADVVSVLMLAPTGSTGQSASDRSGTHKPGRKGIGSDGYGSEAEI